MSEKICCLQFMTLLQKYTNEAHPRNATVLAESLYPVMCVILSLTLETVEKFASLLNSNLEPQTTSFIGSHGCASIKHT